MRRRHLATVQDENDAVQPSCSSACKGARFLRTLVTGRAYECGFLLLARRVGPWLRRFGRCVTWSSDEFRTSVSRCQRLYLDTVSSPTIPSTMGERLVQTDSPDVLHQRVGLGAPPLQAAVGGRGHFQPEAQAGEGAQAGPARQGRV